MTSSAGAGPAAYGLEHQARCVAPFYQGSRPDGIHRFLVGTSSCSGPNKLYVIDYHEATRVADCSAVWPHEGEVWGLWCSPSLSAEATLFASYTPAEDHCSIYRVRPSANGAELNDFGLLTSLPVGTRQVVWDREGLQVEVRASSARDVAVYRLETTSTSTSQPVVRYALPTSASTVIQSSADPHRAHITGVATENNLFFCDTRAKKIINGNISIDTVVGGSLRGLDFSCATPDRILTACSDGSVLFWDGRQLSAPVSASAQTSLHAHQHHCLGASFHPYHDQLVLSWGSDHTAKVFDLQQASSATASPVTSTTVPKVRHLWNATPEKSLTDFGESVYSATWSNSGTWIFAGVSFHGKVLVDAVPQASKMRILLSKGSGGPVSEDF